MLGGFKRPTVEPRALSLDELRVHRHTPQVAPLVDKEVARLKAMPELGTADVRRAALVDAQTTMTNAVLTSDKQTERKARILVLALDELCLEDRVRTWPTWKNQLPNDLAAEMAYARARNFEPLLADSRALKALCDDGTPVKFVVTRDVQLRFGPDDIKHPVLAPNQDVLAAGFVTLILYPGMPKTVAELNNNSGHFRPPASSLAVAREAFQRAGFTVPPSSTKEHQE